MSNSNQNQGEWDEYLTQDGKKYYHNRLTNQTSWIAPTLPSALPQAASPWSEETDGFLKYYFNKITKETSWEKPDGF